LVVPISREALLGKPLSGKEEAVLNMAANGMSSIEIAVVLKRSTDTVKTHLRRVYAKLGARNAAHAVRIAYQIGYFKLPERREI